MASSSREAYSVPVQARAGQGVGLVLNQPRTPPPRRCEGSLIHDATLLTRRCSFTSSKAARTNVSNVAEMTKAQGYRKLQGIASVEGLRDRGRACALPVWTGFVLVVIINSRRSADRADSSMLFLLSTLFASQSAYSVEVPFASTTHP